MPCGCQFPLVRQQAAHGDKNKKQFHDNGHKNNRLGGCNPQTANGLVAAFGDGGKCNKRQKNHPVPPPLLPIECCEPCVELANPQQCHEVPVKMYCFTSRCRDGQVFRIPLEATGAPAVAESVTRIKCGCPDERCDKCLKAKHRCEKKDKKCAKKPRKAHHHQKPQKKRADPHAGPAAGIDIDAIGQLVGHNLKFT